MKFYRTLPTMLVLLKNAAKVLGETRKREYFIKSNIIYSSFYYYKAYKMSFKTNFPANPPLPLPNQPPHPPPQQPTNHPPNTMPNASPNHLARPPKYCTATNLKNKKITKWSKLVCVMRRKRRRMWTMELRKNERSGPWDLSMTRKPRCKRLSRKVLVKVFQK
jgi:hypothetical protein